MTVKTKLRRAKIVAQRAMYQYPQHIRNLPTNLWRTTKFFPAMLKGELMLSTSQLSIVHHIAATGEDIDYGVVSKKAVTYNFANHIAAALGNVTNATADFITYKYHDTGTGAVGAPDSSLNTDFKLITPATVYHSPTTFRTTASSTVVTPGGGATPQTNGAAKYKSIATTTYLAGVPAPYINEHGLFTHALYTDVWGGTNVTTDAHMMDRHTFTAIQPLVGDSITFTYEITLNA